MGRLMLFVALFCQSSMVFGQSTTAATGNSQMPNELTMVQGPFDFSSGLPGQRAVTPTFRSFSCNAPKTAKAQANAPIDLDNLFNQSCADLKSHVDLFARNEVFFCGFRLHRQFGRKRKARPFQRNGQTRESNKFRRSGII
jgi:hypothetical protein